MLQVASAMDTLEHFSAQGGLDHFPLASLADTQAFCSVFGLSSLRSLKICDLVIESVEAAYLVCDTLAIANTTELHMS